MLSTFRDVGNQPHFLYCTYDSSREKKRSISVSFYSLFLSFLSSRSAVSLCFLQRPRYAMINFPDSAIFSRWKETESTSPGCRSHDSKDVINSREERGIQKKKEEKLPLSVWSGVVLCARYDTLPLGFCIAFNETLYFMKGGKQEFFIVII
jgi:hypothetical protein